MDNRNVVVQDGTPLGIGSDAASHPGCSSCSSCQEIQETSPGVGNYCAPWLTMIRCLLAICYPFIKLALYHSEEELEFFIVHQF